MFQAPFSKPDVNDVMSSSPVFKIHPSLNHWSGGRLPKARGKRLFGLVVIALLLLGLQLTACGNAAPSSISSTSPTSNSTSQPITPSTTSAPGSTSASTTTAGPTTVPTTMPTTGPTTGPTVVPTADPSSFSITVQGGTFCYTGTAGQTNVTNTDFPSPLDLVYSGSANPAPGPLNWSVSALAVPTEKIGSVSCSDPSRCTILSGNWLSFNPSSGSLPYGSPNQTVALHVSHAANMPVGVYCTMIQFYPVNSGKTYAYAELLIAAAPSGPTVSSINPTGGPATGGTSITITGSGFTGATGVSFGSTAASGFTVNSDTQITATSPAGSGTVDVTVTTPNGTSATGAADQFTYT